MESFVISLTIFCTLIGVRGIGVDYGLVGDNLPAPEQAVAFIKHKGFTSVRLFEPNLDVLEALRGSNLDVLIGTLNEDLKNLSGDPSFAAQWVATYVAPFAASVKFRYISAANEVIPGNGKLGGFVLPAMKNLAGALKAANLSVPVTTAVSAHALGASYPPSQGAFSDETAPLMGPILSYLEANNYPLLINIYPYFAYANDQKNIRLDYAIFNATSDVVSDGDLSYRNLFDAIVDAFYSAIERAGAPGTGVVVSETGWPTAGNGDIATVEIAATHNNNLVAHVAGGRGTPKRPAAALETYLFALFNENRKRPGIEQNFGLFYPNMTEVYPLNLSPKTA